MKAAHIPSLTALRFFAAAAIVYFHLQIYRVVATKPDPNFALGVSFFFVLSGFILAYNYQDMAATGLRRFYIARVARLLPVHLATFFLASAVIVPWQSWTAGQVLVTVPYNLTLTHAWLPLNGMVFSWNAVSWSISAEFFFYLFFPVLVLSQRLWLWTAGFLALALAIVTAVHFTIGQGPQAGMLAINGTHAVLQFPPSRIFEFALGVMAGRAFAAGYRLPGNPTVVELAAIGALVATITLSGYVETWLRTNGAPSFAAWLDQSGCALAFALLILAIGSGRGLIGRLISHPAFELLGKISFATYMVHHIIIGVAAKHGLVALVGRPAAVVVLLVAIYVTSWTVWRWIEEPMRRLITGRLAPLGHARDAQPQSAR